MPSTTQIAVIQSGYFKGRRMIVPAEPKPRLVLIEKGVNLNGSPNFHKACMIHDEWVPTYGCSRCGDKPGNGQQ